MNLICRHVGFPPKDFLKAKANCKNKPQTRSLRGKKKKAQQSPHCAKPANISTQLFQFTSIIGCLSGEKVAISQGFPPLGWLLVIRGGKESLFLQLNNTAAGTRIALFLYGRPKGQRSSSRINTAPCNEPSSTSSVHIQYSMCTLQWVNTGTYFSSLKYLMI